MIDDKSHEKADKLTYFGAVILENPISENGIKSELA